MSEVGQSDPGRRTSLLIIDDDLLQRMIVRRIAGNLGFEVDEAGALEDVRQALSRRRFDLAIVDLDLGDSDGVECIRLITDKGQSPDIVVLSGHDERIRDAVLRYAHAVGLRTIGTLRKPVDVQILKDLLRSHLVPRVRTHSTDVGADAIRAILSRKDHSIRFRSKHSLVDGRIVAAEVFPYIASVRRLSSEKVNLGLEDPKLAIDLVCRTLSLAVDEVAAWPGHIALAINVPQAALSETSLPHRLVEILRASAVAPDRLTVEVIETPYLLSRLSDAAYVLSRMRICGIHICVDKFGHSTSSLTALSALPFDELKMSGALVSQIGTDRDALSMFRAGVGIGREFGMTITAAGVDDVRTRDVVAELGCDQAQGLLYSGFISLAEFRYLVASKPAVSKSEPHGHQ